MIIVTSARAAKMASFDHPDDEDIELSESCETMSGPIIIRVMTELCHYKRDVTLTNSWWSLHEVGSTERSQRRSQCAILADSEEVQPAEL